MNKIGKLKFSKYACLAFLIFLVLFFSFGASAETSPDAIAIRVMPNPDYTSALSWYKNNIRVQGSPQNLTVDGYEAVRDGRTVYVNAANVVDTNNDGALDHLYANVYIISYNQSAEDKTLDIFGQMLAHWQFNSNLGNADLKAAVARDTKRLADLADLKAALENYKNKNSRYPELAAGSYMPNKSISTWPSWQATLGQALGKTMPVDPINELGACNGYDSITCWDQVNNKFADPTPNNNIFNLPSGSHAYAYIAANDGSSYSNCASMESGFASLPSSDTACPQDTQVGFSGVADNNAPTISGQGAVYSGDTVNVTLSLKTGDALNYFLQASDPNGDSLTWSLDSSAIDWTGKAWSAAPIIKNTGAINNKTIYAARVGGGGTYNFSVVISDSRGGGKVINFTINVCEPNCSNKNCGPDSCGGTCGTCSSSNVCSAGQCCPTSANVQVCSDNCHWTYFNGSQVSEACEWGSIQAFPVDILVGKNVLAVKALDYTGQYGFSATLNRGSCTSMTTNDITNWKCTNVYPGDNWMNVDYNDSSWSVAKLGYTGTSGGPAVNGVYPRPGNVLPYKQIWAQGAGESATIYCRYSFITY